MKVNQIGSVTESIEAVRMSTHAGWGLMSSHCKFENELIEVLSDAFVSTTFRKLKSLIYFILILLQWSFIADLSVGLLRHGPFQAQGGRVSAGRGGFTFKTSC